MKRKLKRVVAIASIIMLSLTNVLQSYAVDSTDLVVKLGKKTKTKEEEIVAIKLSLTKLICSINETEESLISLGKQTQLYEEELVEAKAEYKDASKYAMGLISNIYGRGDKKVANKLKYIKSTPNILDNESINSKLNIVEKEAFSSLIFKKEKVELLQSRIDGGNGQINTLKEKYHKDQQKIEKILTTKGIKIKGLEEQLAFASMEFDEIRKKPDEEALKLQKEREKKRKAQQLENQKSADAQTQLELDSISEHNLIVDRAMSQLGKPYVWGKAGPEEYDCSGLVSFAITGSNVRLGTSSYFGCMPRVDKPQPGDLCCTLGHVGIYIGNGNMVHAPQDGDKVKISKVEEGMWFTRY